MTSSTNPVMTKDETKARTALSKDVATELRWRAKNAGWKVYRGWLFREDDGWFVDAWCDVEQRKTTVTVHLKPMGIDPIFWDIVLAPQNRNQPLSFRLWGAWTIKAPGRNEHKIDNMGLDAPALTDCVLSIASQELVRTRENRSIETFIDFARQRRRGRELMLLQSSAHTYCVVISTRRCPNSWSPARPATPADTSSEQSLLWTWQ